MRAELSDYSNREIKVVGVFKGFGSVKGKKKSKIIIRDLINADTGEYLADHVWIDLNSEISNLNLQENEKLFFVGKVCKYKKGYMGHNLGNVLDSRAPSYDYTFSRVHNFCKKSNYDYNLEYLKKLKDRRDYILNKKKHYLARKDQVKLLIAETESGKQKYRDNSVLDVHPVRTIEPTFSNRFSKFPLLYSLIDAGKKNLGFFEKFKSFFTTYKDIISYHLNKENIKMLNSDIISSYRENRLINRKLENIDSLVNTIDEFMPTIENKVNSYGHIIWEILDDSAYEFEKTKRKVKTKS